MKTNETPKPLRERITQPRAGFTFTSYTGSKTDNESAKVGVTGEWDVAYTNVKGNSSDECHANAVLIAEAFNVTHETGRTPRELAADVTRLRDALTNLERRATFGTVSQEYLREARAALTPTAP